jgi:hypothetical protein
MNICACALQRNRAVQLGPSAVGGGGAGRIPASRPRSRPGRRWGTNTCSPRARGRAGLERESLRRGRAATAGGGTAAGCGPGGGRAMPRNGWWRKLLWLLGSRSGGLVAPGKGRGGELAGGRQWRDGGGRWRAGKGDGSDFIGALAPVTKW